MADKLKALRDAILFELDGRVSAHPVGSPAFLEAKKCAAQARAIDLDQFKPESTNDALQLAKQFHSLYERRAPEFGYETREKTRTFDETSLNGRLMIAVCQEIMTQFKPVVGSEQARLAMASLKGISDHLKACYPKLGGDADCLDNARILIEHLSAENESLKARVAELENKLEEKMKLADEIESLLAKLKANLIVEGVIQERTDD